MVMASGSVLVFCASSFEGLGQACVNLVTFFPHIVMPCSFAVSQLMGCNLDTINFSLFQGPKVDGAIHDLHVSHRVVPVDPL